MRRSCARRMAHGRIRVDRYGRGAGHAGRARHLYRRGSRQGRVWRAHQQIAAEEPRRLAAEGAGAPGADRPTRCASSATPSRSWSPRRQSQADEAAEAVDVDIEPLPAVVDARKAAGGRARRGVGRGTRQPRARLSLRRARQGRCRVRHGRARHAACGWRTSGSSSPRWSRAPAWPTSTGPAGASRCYAPTQGVLGSKANAAGLMKVAPDKMRFVAVNVGGSFGMKAAVFPEYVCAMHAARDLGRPVKWTDTRSECVHVRSPRPRAGFRRVARARQGRPHSRAAARRLGGHGRLPHELRPADADDQRREARDEPLPHAAGRSVARAACSPTPCRSRPIAARAGPRATTTWSD